MKNPFKRRSVIPGFGLTMGLTITYLSLIVIVPLSTLFFKTATLSWDQFWNIILDPRIMASLRLSFGASLFAGFITTFFGLIVAWVLVRYPFPGRGFVDLLVDLPFALPTAVAGIALTTIYSQNGVIGRYLDSLGIQVAFTPLGVTVALIFIGFPFAVRSIQPVLKDLDADIEEAASSMGAGRLQTIFWVILPTIFPSILSGFAMAFARALGEYGSVVFISGNLPLKTEIAPLLILTKLEQYDYAGATAIALVMLVASFLLLFMINWLQWRKEKHV